MDKTIVHLQEGGEELWYQGKWKALHSRKGVQEGERKGRCGGERGLWEQHRARLAAMGLPVCCSLGRLPFVQIRAGDTAKLFLSLFFVIQTDRVFLWLPYTIHFRSNARGYSIRDLNNAMCKFIMLSVPEHVA